MYGGLRTDWWEEVGGYKLRSELPTRNLISTDADRPNLATYLHAREPRVAARRGHHEGGAGADEREEERGGLHAFLAWRCRLVSVTGRWVGLNVGVHVRVRRRPAPRPEFRRRRLARRAAGVPGRPQSIEAGP